MSTNPFTAAFDSLPHSLAIFPLEGSILLPGGELPLNIFEPRYLNMIDDAMSGHRMIGMIQPDPAGGGESGLFRIGCAGRITRYRETSDCRLEIVVSGICRFEVEAELPSLRGYRVIQPDWSRFAADYDNLDALYESRKPQLLAALKMYFQTMGFETEMDKLEKLPVMRLVDSLTMALPFEVQEKQMILESITAESRLDNFLALIANPFDDSQSATRH